MTNDERSRLICMEQFGDLTVGLSPGSHRSFVIVNGSNVGGLEANCGVDGERNRAKADFFAAAPSVVRQLLERVEELEAELEVADDALEVQVETIRKLRALPAAIVGKVKDVAATYERMARRREVNNGVAIKADLLREVVTALEKMGGG